MFKQSLSTKVPAQSELYYWADYVELLCLSDIDGQFSVDRFAQLLHFADDLMATAPEAQDGETSDIEEMLLNEISLSVGLSEEDREDPAADAYDEQDEDLEDGEEPSYTDFGRSAEQTDDRRTWASNIFVLLADRAKVLGDAYPFLVDETAMRIEKRSITSHHFAYVFFLACSALAYVPRTTMAELTKHFEVVSFAVLRVLVGSSFEVDVYGTAKGLAASRFVGSQFERLQQLATELNGTVACAEVDFHPRDRGDNGLDLVAWLPMLDRGKGTVAIFCQCACGQKWDGKQYEASYERWREFITLKSPPTKMTFIPHLFRKPGGYWYSESDVSGVLVDRIRALQLAHQAVTDALPTGLVNDALAFRLPTV